MTSRPKHKAAQARHEHEEGSACRLSPNPGAEKCSLDAEVNDGVIQELVPVQATEVVGIDLHCI